jgi:sugar phosphate isomerase/epimerase
MFTRREFGLLTLSTLALPAVARAQTVNGVRIGVQTYSFRQLPRTPDGDMVDVVIRAMRECGLTDCELFAPQIEPPGAGRRGTAATQPDMRRMPLDAALARAAGIRKKFSDAGMTINAYNYSFAANFSDEDIDRGFAIAKALGTDIITASTTLAVAKRVIPYAEKHQIVVAMHNHSNITDPNEFATPESFAAAMKMSKYFKVNLDIGHFTAANFDAVAYIREHHANITNLHIKDRRRNQGDNMPWGQGDTPIREVLQLLKREKWPIRAHVEYEHKGEAGPVAEVQKCVAFVNNALA